MSKKILHVIYNDKFIPQFINNIKENNIVGEHIFLYFGGASVDTFPIPNIDNIHILRDSDKKIQKLKKFILFYKADKIILHSLFNPSLIKFLYVHFWLLKKCYWVIWGGDLYYHILRRKNSNYAFMEKKRKRVIKKMSGLITYIKGDYELAQKWYDAKGKYCENFMYPSNLYKECNLQSKKHKTINIQVGNSADPSNYHIDVFEKLKKFKDDNIKIYVPLSYGNQTYAKKVIKKGKSIFGSKFEALTKFMPFEQYLQFLADIDIAIFNHNRQQAMGNTITLLGLGKKVYLRKDNTPWKMFQDIKINIFDINKFSIDLIDPKTKEQNKKIVQEYFSEENYIKQLNELMGT